MSSSPTPRPLEERDLAELVQLCREHAAYERSPWVEYERTEGLRALLLDPDDARCWVIEGDGELAGFASVTLQRATWEAGHYLYLDCLFLRPAYRGRGLGRDLMNEVSRFARSLGTTQVQWQTPAWNVDAVRFYHRLGARPEEKLRFTLELEPPS